MINSLFFISFIFILISSAAGVCTSSSNCYDCLSDSVNCDWCESSKTCVSSGSCSGDYLFSQSQCCRDSSSNPLGDCETCNKENGCTWCTFGTDKCKEKTSCDSSDTVSDCSTASDAPWAAYVFPAIWVAIVVAAIIQKKKKQERVRRAAEEQHRNAPAPSKPDPSTAPDTGMNSAVPMVSMAPPPMVYSAPPAYAAPPPIAPGAYAAPPAASGLMCPQCSTPVGTGPDGQTARFCSGCGVAFA